MGKVYGLDNLLIAELGCDLQTELGKNRHWITS